MKKQFLNRIFHDFACATGLMFLFNKLHNRYAARTNLLKASPENYFDWDGEKIYFNCVGSGEPILLLHALHPAASSIEWLSVLDLLSKNHRVYVLDLPGCGRSSKSRAQYTGFYYIKFIQEFMHKMALHDLPVVASNLTSAITVMASIYDPTLFSKIVVISPPSLSSLNETPDLISKAKMLILSTPVLGTFIYKLLCSKSEIDLAFTEKYFYNPFHDNDELVDMYFESSQIGKGKGHYFTGRLLGKYLNINISHVLSGLSVPLKLIEGAETQNADQVLNEWSALNPSIETVTVEHTRQLPHLEEPEKTSDEILSFIDSVPFS